MATARPELPYPCSSQASFLKALSLLLFSVENRETFWKSLIRHFIIWSVQRYKFILKDVLNAFNIQMVASKIPFRCPSKIVPSRRVSFVGILTSLHKKEL